MNKKLRTCICFALLTLLIAASACSDNKVQPSTEPIMPIVEPTDAPSTQAPLTPTPTPVLFYSNTTGLGYEGQPQYHPVTVMIENSAEARPQTGLMQADIVYEMPVEGGITRFLCLFNDTLPVEVGPVRSARIYFLHTQKEWDSAMVHYGGPSDEGFPSYIYGEEMEYIKLRVDGIKGKWDSYFWRSEDRKAPHNVYTDLTKIAELYDYTPEFRNQLRFDANLDTSAGMDYSMISLSFQTNEKTHTQFKYDPATNRLLRYVSQKEFMTNTVTLDANGQKQTITEQVSCQNLIIQHTKVYVIQGDKSGRRMAEMTGSGECEFFIGGKFFTGTWKRDSLNSATEYRLSDGSLLTLLPGNTWIAIQPTNGTVTIE